MTETGKELLQLLVDEVERIRYNADDSLDDDELWDVWYTLDQGDFPDLDLEGTFLGFLTDDRLRHDLQFELGGSLGQIWSREPEWPQARYFALPEVARNGALDSAPLWFQVEEHYRRIDAMLDADEVDEKAVVEQLWTLRGTQSAEGELKLIELANDERLTFEQRRLCGQFLGYRWRYLGTLSDESLNLLTEPAQAAAAQYW